ncbi:hypothetical protein EC991_001800 [Linnemannia zychae]|nr:hypothetical protein EC991_001800 [Linnemannia zychae]
MSGKRQVSTTPLFSSYQQHALSIPEILEQILSFLNRRDRRHTARLVCRQWFTVCQFVPYTWTFRIKSDGDDDDYANTKKSSRADNENEEKDILTKVSLAEHLTIRVDDLSAKNQPSQQRLNFWTKAMGLLSDLVDDSKLTGKRLRLQSLYLTSAEPAPTLRN